MKKIIPLALWISCLPAFPANAQSNLAPNPSFENSSDWQVTPQSQASGSYRFDTSRARNGKQAIKLTKTNGLGYMELRSVKPIRIEANITYTFRGWFHAEDAPISSLLLFRTSTDGKKLAYNSIDRSAGFKSQSLLINSPSGKWEERMVTYRSDKAQDIYLHVALWGNPSSVWLDDMELTSAKPTAVSPPATFADTHNKEQVLEILQKRANATAQVLSKNGIPHLQVNNTAEPFIFYKGMQPSERNGDITAFGKAGVNLVSVAVQLGQSRYAYVPATSKPIWQGKDKVNTDVVDEIILSVLRRNPQANVILELWAYPYREWGDENPDEIVHNAKGERGYGIWGNLTGYTDDLEKVGTSQNKAWWYPSYQSEKWRADSQAAFKTIAEHLKTSVYGKAVVGFFISGGQDLRFDPFFYDYSKPSEQSFRAWTLKKYGTVEKVAKAWKQPLTTPEQIKVPQFESNQVEDLTPYQTTGPLMDYREFKDEGSWSLRDGYARAVKEGIGKPVVALSYNSPVSKNFLTSQHVDGSGAMTYYPYRNPGYSLGWLPGDGYKYHQKMFLQEVDLRSYVGSRYPGIQQTWIGAGLTPETWDAIHRKMIGASLAQGSGWWYYDMGRYFADAALHERIAQTYKVAKRLTSMPEPVSQTEVCLIARDAPDPYLSGRFTAIDFGNDYQKMMLESSGVPLEKHYLEDVLANSALQNFKVYIFQHLSSITQEQRRQIKEKLLNKNRTIVWMGDTGYISENGKSVQAMSQLIGMNIGTQEKYMRLNALVSDTNSALTKDVMPLQGAGEMLMEIFNSNNGPSSAAARYQPFWIEDNTAKVFGRYHETGQAAMATKQLPDWTSIYLAAPQALGSQLLHNIAAQAGANIAGDVGQALHINSNFASLHALESRTYRLNLPNGKKRILDAVSGKVLADNKANYSFPIEAQQTYWFLFE